MTIGWIQPMAISRNNIVGNPVIKKVRPESMLLHLLLLTFNRYYYLRAWFQFF